MIETRNGAKYIDKDPPMEEQGQGIIRKILDYLAYLKESLNFVFSTYGRRLVDASGNINELIRTAEETTSRIENAEGNISIISQKAEKIEMVVGTDASGNDYIKAASIVMAINNDTSSIQISADHIDLNGYVTMTDLSTGGRTEINGANITTGFISADRIEANSISVGKLTGTISNNNWVIDLNAGTLTIGNISASNINTGTLNADRISANSLSVEKLTGEIKNGNWKINLTNGTFSIGELSADKITTGTLNADRISANSISVGKLNGSVSNSAGWSVTLGSSPSFSVGYLSADYINAGTIAAERIGTASISADKIASGAITTDKIYAGAITAEKININDLFSQNITASNFNITGGSINVTTSGLSKSVVDLKYGNFFTNLAPGGLWIGDNNSGTPGIITIDRQGKLLFDIDATGLTALVSAYGDLAKTGNIIQGSSQSGIILVPELASAVSEMLLQKGKYVIIGEVTALQYIDFRISISTQSSSTSYGAIATGDNTKILRVTDILDIATPTTYYLTAQHNSSLSVSVNCNFKAIRIA